MVALPPTYGEHVILCVNLDAVPIQVSHGVVPPMMPERKLVGARPERPCDELVSEADPEHGGSGFGETADCVLRVLHGGGISGTIGNEEAVGSLGDDVVRAGVGRDDRDPAAMLSHDLR